MRQPRAIIDTLDHDRLKLPAWLATLLADRIEEATLNGKLSWLTIEKWGELLAVLLTEQFPESDIQDDAVNLSELSHEERIELYEMRAERRLPVCRRDENEAIVKRVSAPTATYHGGNYDDDPYVNS